MPLLTQEPTSAAVEQSFVETIMAERAKMVLLPEDILSPNRGATISDLQAIGPDSESQQQWHQSRGVDKSQHVKIVKVSHVRYQVPDLQKTATFLRDFGMHVAAKTDTEMWFNGYGPDQYVYYARRGPKMFLGGAFEVESYQELEKLVQKEDVKILTDGIEHMNGAPGGGHIVTVQDPEGFPINFICGQAVLLPKCLQIRQQRESLIVNTPHVKPRQRAFQRFDAGPAEVFKLGHFGMVVNDFPSTMQWYIKHFNFVPSDILYLPGPAGEDGQSTRQEVAMFAHIDVGQTLTDHHTLFLTSAPPGFESHVHHCSFEVHDFDTQALGHQWLASKGYESAWGVGRHILGSQVFDYWWDVNNFMIEHYADGDLVNEDTPVGYGPAGHQGLAVWGPEVPRSFLE